MKKQTIIETNILNKKKFKMKFLKSNSPRIKSQIIKRNINTQKGNIKNEIVSINDNNNILIKKKKIDKNMCFLLNGEDIIKGKEIFGINKIKSKNQYNNEPNLINNQKDKYFIFNNNDKNKENDLYKENLKVNENNKETELIKNVENKKPEDITDYLIIDKNEYESNYKINNKKTSNEAIEEVEEAKEMSEVFIPSDLSSPIACKGNSKIIIKDIKSLKNKEIKTKMFKNTKLKNYNSPNKCIKISFIKKKNKKINQSSLSKIIGNSFHHIDNYVGNHNLKRGIFNKKHLRTDINIQNYSNYLIFKSNSNLLSLQNSKIKHLSYSLKNSNESKHKVNKKCKQYLINKENSNIINKRNESNINWENKKGNKRIFKTNVNLDKTSKIKKSSKTCPNSKDIFKIKRHRKSNNFFENSFMKINTSLTSKIKIEERKLLSGYIYNNKKDFFNSKSSEKMEKLKKNDIMKKNDFKLISEKRVKKFKKIDTVINNTSLTCSNLDKIKIKIGKIKNSEEKYHHLLENYRHK